MGSGQSYGANAPRSWSSFLRDSHNTPFLDNQDEALPPHDPALGPGVGEANSGIADSHPQAVTPVHHSQETSTQTHLIAPDNPAALGHSRRGLVPELLQVNGCERWVFKVSWGMKTGKGM